MWRGTRFLSHGFVWWLDWWVALPSPFPPIPSPGLIHGFFAICHLFNGRVSSWALLTIDSLSQSLSLSLSQPPVSFVGPFVLSTAARPCAKRVIFHASWGRKRPKWDLHDSRAFGLKNLEDIKWKSPSTVQLRIKIKKKKEKVLQFSSERRKRKESGRERGLCVRVCFYF